MNKNDNACRDVYLDIAPICEAEWTGIPVVAAQLALHGLKDSRRNWYFLYNNQIVGNDFVQAVLISRTGKWIEAKLLDILCRAALPRFESMAQSVAIFTNVKSYRRMFWREAIVIHDLSTILMPQYHHTDTVAHHANRVRGDIDSSDAVVCVSKATAGDVRAYFKAPAEKIVLAPLGVSWDLRTRVQAATMLEHVELSPFVLVLGTVEPRKNIGLVLDFILEKPDVLALYNFVFVGGDGWLNERSKLESKLTGFGLDMRRIIFTGYVSEPAKLALLCRAAFTIYPSMFEGFGLPVLESVSVNCPVLCSMSSSLPEVVNNSCILFDPTDIGSFSSAFAEMVRVTSARSRSPTDPLDFSLAEHFGWDRFFRPIDEWLEGLDERFPY